MTGGAVNGYRCLVFEYGREFQLYPRMPGNDRLTVNIPVRGGSSDSVSYIPDVTDSNVCA